MLAPISRPPAKPGTASKSLATWPAAPVTPKPTAAGPGWQHRTAASATAPSEERAKREAALAGTWWDRTRLRGGTADPTTPAPWPARPASGSGDARR